MSGKPRYYWDACIYIAWLKKEPSDSLVYIEHIARLNRERRNIIFTSVLTMMEVLESRLTREQSREFTQCFDFGNHVRWDVDMPVVSKARHYREHYLVNKIGNKSLAVADSIHLATASIHEVDEFHTFDDGGHAKGGEGCSLLALNGDVAGDKLTVCRPIVELPRSAGDTPLLF